MAKGFLRFLYTGFVVVFLCGVSAPAYAEKVRHVIDGDTLVLEGGERVRLLGIDAPELPHEKRAGEPLGEESAQALRVLVEGKDLRLAFGSERRDRHGRLLAQLYLPGEPEVWVQEKMVRDGMAMAYSFPQNRLGAEGIARAQDVAIAAKRGMWADPFFAVQDVAGLKGDERRYMVVEGVVSNVAKVKGHVYVNFGEDWKEDFTLFLPKKGVKAMQEAFPDVLKWKGKRLRMQGWVFFKNGPMIEWTHPEQVMLLDSLAAAKDKDSLP